MFYWHSYATADKAVDGDPDPVMENEKCIHANNEDQPPPQPAWWYVDLGQEYDVYAVKIHTRDRDRRKYLRQPSRPNWWINCGKHVMSLILSFALFR